VLRTAAGCLRQPAAGGDPRRTLCLAASGKHEDVERFYAHLERVMVSSGFLDPQRPGGCCPSCAVCFGRAELERDEINILRGLLDAVEKQVAGPRAG
jgi:tRNA/rRNA methyltransferase